MCAHRVTKQASPVGEGVADSAETLRKLNGQFKVISPNGYIFQVTCRKGTKIPIREIGESEPITFSQVQGWRIERIT
jgi:hypothetical protein